MRHTSRQMNFVVRYCRVKMNTLFNGMVNHSYRFSNNAAVFYHVIPSSLSCQKGEERFAMYSPCDIPVIAAFGNPLYDTSVSITSDELLDKLNVKLDSEREISQEELLCFNEILHKQNIVSQNTGGSSQNTLRSLQWIIEQNNFSVMFGGIGKDDVGNSVEELMKESGVATRYAYHDSVPTGRCIALIKGTQRALVAHIGAAGVYELEHLLSGDNISVLNMVKMIYIEGYFINHSYPVALKLLQISVARNIPLAFNLNSPYLITSHFQEVCEMIKSSSFVFGNEKEYEKLGELMGLKNQNIKEIATFIRNFGAPVANTSSEAGRTVVVTRGKESVYYISDNTGGLVTETAVFQLDQETVYDTTGAGDSFVGGFLAGVFNSKNIDICVKWGCWTAGQIIQQLGHKIPNYRPIAIRDIQ